MGSSRQVLLGLIIQKGLVFIGGLGAKTRSIRVKGLLALMAGSGKDVSTK
jgi:hypothetical protein